MFTMYLIRHGLTEWNKQKRYIGHTDHGVVKDDLIQLTSLKNELQKIQFNYCFSSDLSRCLETYHFLEIPNEILVDPRLREMNFGEWEGKTSIELQKNELFRSWKRNWENYHIPGGESGDDFKARIEAFLMDLIKKTGKSQGNTHKNILIVTHGGVIRYILSRLELIDTFWEFPIKHGRGIQVCFDYVDGAMKAMSFVEIPLED